MFRLKLGDKEVTSTSKFEENIPIDIGQPDQYYKTIFAVIELP